MSTYKLPSSRRPLTDSEYFIDYQWYLFLKGLSTGGNYALTTNPLSQFAATTSAQLAGVISDETGTGSLVFANSPTLTTPNLGTPSTLVLTNATSLPQAQVTGSGWTSYTGTITLVGGAGNTVPTFSVQDARYSRIGNIVCVQIGFGNTSGGTAGAGTGLINVALPIQAGSGLSTLFTGAMGAITSSTSSYAAFASIAASANTFTINFLNGTTATQLTGASLSNPTRYIQMQFFYEV